MLSICIVSIVQIAASPILAAERTIAIAKSGCALAAGHHAAADVRFRPGVDQEGRPVVPADLDDGRADPLRESIPIVISVDLDERFGIPHDSALLGADALVGLVEIRRSDGTLTFNGRPLNDREVAALSVLCREASGAD